MRYMVTPDVNIFVGAASVAYGLPDNRPGLRDIQESVYYLLGDGERFRVATSPYLLGEVRIVLTRQGADARRVDEWINQLRKWTLLVSPQITQDIVLADWDDNNVLNVAVQARAEVSGRESFARHIVVSSDPHLTDLEQYSGIVVARADLFLRIFAGGERVE